MKLYGKSGLKQRLDSIADKGRLSHAVLFSGRSGVGKKTLARYVAELFMCEHGACGECPTCRRIEKDTHPDVMFVKKKFDGKYIVDNIRTVIDDSVIRPNDGDVKVYVFEDCDSMNLNCYNALLKLIEEPADYLRFVFTCETASVIPETVLSRVTEFEVPNTPVKDCEEALIDFGADKAEAKKLSEMFSGNIGTCKAVLDGDNEAILIETADKAADALSSKDGLGVSAALVQITDRIDFSRVMEYISRMLGDALAIKLGGGTDLFREKGSRKLADAFSEEELICMSETTFEIAKNEIYNLNIALSRAYFVSRALGG